MRKLGLSIIFQLENVEAASHTYSHPFKWRIDNLAITPAADFYQASKVPVNYLYETEGSLRFIEHNLLPSNKKAHTLLWSGGCHPDERPLKILAHYKRLNFNGGDPIYDEEHRSLTGLAPISVTYDNCRQIYTSAKNDYLYTSGWTKDYDGMKKACLRLAAIAGGSNWVDEMEAFAAKFAEESGAGDVELTQRLF